MPLLGHSQPAKPEKTRVVGSVTGLHQVRHDLAHHTTKLEAVSREPVSNEHLENLRMAVQYKVLIRAVREHACLEGEVRAHLFAYRLRPNYIRLS